MKAFQFPPDLGGQPTLTPASPTYVEAVVLATNTPAVLTIPAGAAYVLFSADGDFYAKPGAAAAVPGVSTTDGSASQINPKGWALSSETTIGLVAIATRVVTAAFYRRNP